MKYTSRIEEFMPLPIPMETATNKDEVAAYKAKKESAAKNNTTLLDSDLVRPKITFDACLQSFMAEEEVPDWYSPAVQGKTVASKRCRLSTFPDYLFIQLKKFDVGADWKPIKLDVEVQMPDEIDLACLKGTGKQVTDIFDCKMPTTLSLPTLNTSQAHLN